MIANINMNINDVLNGDKELAQQRLVDPEVYATFSTKNNVLDFITELIGDKLRNITIKSDEILSNRSLYKEGESYVKIVDINNIIREVAIYYVLAFIDEENISEELVQSGMEFIRNNFDIKAIIENFSKDGVKLTLLGSEMSENIDDNNLSLSYTMNEEYINNQYDSVIAMKQDKSREISNVAPTDPQTEIPKEGK